MNIQGVGDLDKTFRELPRTMQTKAYYKALGRGARVVRDAAESNVTALVSDEASGVLAKNLVVNRLKKRRGFYRMAVRVKKGVVNTTKIVKGVPVRVGLYGSVLEYGSKKLNRPPKSWLRKAIREQRSQALQSITTEMSRNMLAAINAAKDAAGVSGKRYKI